MDDLRSRALRAAGEAAQRKISDAEAADAGEKANARNLLMMADRACQREFGIKQIGPPVTEWPLLTVRISMARNLMVHSYLAATGGR